VSVKRRQETRATTTSVFQGAKGPLCYLRGGLKLTSPLIRYKHDAMPLDPRDPLIFFCVFLGALRGD
jgi:hypothetical protein